MLTLPTFTDKQYFQAWAVCFTIYLVWIHRWPGRRLDHIRSVGSKSPLFSFIGAFEFIYNARDMILRGCAAYPNSVFRVPNFGRWRVVVNGPDLIEEYRKAPDSVLSPRDASKEFLQVPFTLGHNLTVDHYHIPIVRSQLTRNLSVLFPSLYEEIVLGFDELINVSVDGGVSATNGVPTELTNTSGWTKLRVVETMRPIVCRTSNRTFVGAPLCRDPDYVELNIQFAMTVVKAATALNLIPSFLRPIAAYFLTSVPASINRGVEHLKPIIEERRRKIAEYGKEYPDKPVDFLSWLMDKASTEESSLENLTLRILAVNFASIHSSSMAFSEVLFHLAAHPEYVQALRDEIQEVVDKEGWTHAAISNMVKVDSFVKETQRVTSPCLAMDRIARQPFTFSDGTYVPAGTLLQVAIESTHVDDSNYSDPNTFNPFRFVDKGEKVGEGRREDLTSTHVDYLLFGHGMRACPGRFFAATELKLMLAHVVMTYDVKLDGPAPGSVEFLTWRVPNPNGEVLLRKRRVRDS